MDPMDWIGHCDRQIDYWQTMKRAILSVHRPEDDDKVFDDDYDDEFDGGGEASPIDVPKDFLRSVDGPPFLGQHRVSDDHWCGIIGMHFHIPDKHDSFLRPAPNTHWKIGSECRIVCSLDGDTVLCEQHKFDDRA